MREFKTKRRTIRHYDQLAVIYEAQYAKEQEAKIRTALSNAKPRQNEFILDVGCGTGLLFEHVADSAGLIVGIDASSKILQEAHKHTKSLLNVIIIRADADFTPFKNQVFDSTFAVTLLQNMPIPLRTLEEMKRVSKPQSRIIVTGLRKKFTRESFMKLLLEAGLNVTILTMDSQLKEHVAVCPVGEKTLERFVDSPLLGTKMPTMDLRGKREKNGSQPSAESKDASKKS